MTIQVHTITTISAHIPNRGADGLAKRAVVAGIERQRISYQAQQYALRHSPAMAELEKAAGIGHTIRTALVGEELLRPALNKAGIAAAQEWTDAVMALWRKAIDKGDDQNEGEPAPEGGRGAEVKESAAPLIVGEQEVRLFAAAVRACADAGVAPTELRALVEKKASKSTPPAVATALEALRVARGAVGLDGSLFGRMATGVAVASVHRAVRISDALTTHAITPVVDFFLTTDDLKDREAGETGGSHINTREGSTGVFYRHILIDTQQLVRNGVDPAVLISPLVKALLSVSPIGNRAPARTVDALVEVDGQTRSLMDAFAVPVSEPGKAVARLRETAQADYVTFGEPRHVLWLSEQEPIRVDSLAAATLAAWKQ